MLGEEGRRAGENQFYAILLKMGTYQFLFQWDSFLPGEVDSVYTEFSYNMSNLSAEIEFTFVEFFVLVL